MKTIPQFGHPFTSTSIRQVCHSRLASSDLHAIPKNKKDVFGAAKELLTARELGAISTSQRLNCCMKMLKAWGSVFTDISAGWLLHSQGL